MASVSTAGLPSQTTHDTLQDSKPQNLLQSSAPSNNPATAFIEAAPSNLTPLQSVAAVNLHHHPPIRQPVTPPDFGIASSSSYDQSAMSGFNRPRGPPILGSNGSVPNGSNPDPGVPSDYQPSNFNMAPTAAPFPTATPNMGKSHGSVFSSSGDYTTATLTTTTGTSIRMTGTAPSYQHSGPEFPSNVPTWRLAHDARPKVTATLWEDEGTLCFQVEANGICVARREDNDMINGTKLLNVAGMTRGRRDGILKTEKRRHVVKVGAMHLKGVWIPFDRALVFANKEKITDILYPLFVEDIKSILYDPLQVKADGMYSNSSLASNVTPDAASLPNTTASTTASSSAQTHEDLSHVQPVQNNSTRTSASHDSNWVPDQQQQQQQQQQLKDSPFSNELSSSGSLPSNAGSNSASMSGTPTSGFIPQYSGQSYDIPYFWNAPTYANQNQQNHLNMAYQQHQQQQQQQQQHHHHHQQSTQQTYPSNYPSQMDQQSMQPSSYEPAYAAMNQREGSISAYPPSSASSLPTPPPVYSYSQSMPSQFPLQPQSPNSGVAASSLPPNGTGNPITANSSVSYQLRPQFTNHQKSTPLLSSAQKYQSAPPNQMAPPDLYPSAVPTDQNGEFDRKHYLNDDPNAPNQYFRYLKRSKTDA